MRGGVGVNVRDGFWKLEILLGEDPVNEGFLLRCGLIIADRVHVPTFIDCCRLKFSLTQEVGKFPSVIGKELGLPPEAAGISGALGDFHLKEGALVSSLFFQNRDRRKSESAGDRIKP